MTVVTVDLQPVGLALTARALMVVVVQITPPYLLAVAVVRAVVMEGPLVMTEAVEAVVATWKVTVSVAAVVVATAPVALAVPLAVVAAVGWPPRLVILHLWLQGIPTSVDLVDLVDQVYLMVVVVVVVVVFWFLVEY